MPAKKEYTLWASLNGIEVNKKVSDLDAAIAALKPDWLHTDVYFKVTKGDATSERRLLLRDAKRMFNDDFVRQVFITNLLLP
jgi:hypothetical protein